MKNYYATPFSGNGRKWMVSFHNGHDTHKDGSPFYDVRIMKSKKAMNQFTKELEAQGYKPR